jgi:hypothetical protein
MQAQPFSWWLAQQRNAVRYSTVARRHGIWAVRRQKAQLAVNGSAAFASRLCTLDKAIFTVPLTASAFILSHSTLLEDPSEDTDVM